ncbi:TIGR01458 family HAD-type hydrolase [Rhabdothermincola salaria]|uniref:TIGR01458 family HAD-type hydrolase n=1 Tax=Rhabdothermincola salaria TaxID=2903142 RepID=UPI001E47400C|nr:TIGR01458 family HAD-type hydrolase [Rhabdothermincola salaria]MCD9623962.1 TIGR01458 family HAD-type hydrolase [Rhabdothermincola salaria]
MASATDLSLDGRPVRGLLIDIDGVLTVSWEPIPGAIDTLARLRQAGVPFRLLTNTTSRSRSLLAETLVGAGFEVRDAEVLNAPSATAGHLRGHHPGARCWVLSSGDVGEDLEGVTVVGGDEAADVVVLGGAGPEFTYEAVDHAFRLLTNGAALVAMHRNLTWKVAEGLALDSGAYVAGLEAAAGVEATVVGKPSPAFFDAALAELDLDAGEVVMVGDDIDADVLGAQGAGVRGVLVRTGKFRPDVLDGASGRPDAVIDSIADLTVLLDGGRPAR